MPVLASTIAPPYNLGEIARISQATVLAEAVGSRTEMRGQIPFTYTTFRVIRDVAGDRLGVSFTVEAKGGVVGDVAYTAPGTPKFEPGSRYLLFLDRGAQGNWRLKMSSYGVLRETPGTGLLAPVPEAAELDVLPRAGVEGVGVYREADLLTHLAAVKAGSPWHRQASEATSAELVAAAGLQEKSADTGVAGAPLHTAPAACQFITGTTDGRPVRWFGFETGGSTGIWHTTPGQAGISDGGVAAVQQGAAAWTNHVASAINLNYLGSKPSTANCSDNVADVPGEVTFNDPCSQMPALGSCQNPGAGWTSSTCCGEVAQYGYLYNPGTQLYDGETWHPLTGFSVVVNDGTQCLGETDFKEAITHFEGHGLGFNHHTDPDATMYVNLGVHAPRGAALGTTDKVCASYAYHSFLDVPYSHFAWKFIEAVRANGVNDGCGAGNFCPDTVITRGIMAVFLLKSKEGAAYVPPACVTPTFSDMPCSNPLAPWVEELVRRGVTAGCGNGQYCPDNPVTRAQVAVFLIKTVEGPSYVPPACVTPTFNDVPCSDPFAPWVKEIVIRGLTAGCGGGNYCPNTGLTRAQIAVFVSVNFGLPIPVP
ncbi:MAG: S-layer homology domain-containing protein [Thermoanaerobaculia bacterium]